MELQMLDEIQAHVETLVHLVNTEYGCRLGVDFGAVTDEYIVEYAFLQSDFCAQAFYANFVKKCKQAANINLFTLSLLHELGHFETDEYMRDDESQREKIQAVYNKDKKKGMEQYLKLYNEAIATQWACDWLLENYTIVKAWDKTLVNLMTLFIEKNNIEC